MTTKYKIENYLIGHNGSVTSLSLSIDGSLLVTGSKDNSIIVWKIDSNRNNSVNETTENYEIKKPEIYKTLNGHTNVVQQVLISNDNRFVVSASWDKTVRIWNIGSGECVKIISGHKNEVMGVSLFDSVNNFFKKISSVSRDQSLMILNFENWDELVNDVQGVEFVPQFFTTAHKDWITACKYPPPTATKIAFPNCYTCGVDGMIYKWGENLLKQMGYIVTDLQDQEDENQINHNGRINNIEFSPDASFVSSAGEDGSLILWYAEVQGEKGKIYSFNCASPINQVSFSPTSYVFLAACKDYISFHDLISKDCFGQIILKPYDSDDDNDHQSHKPYLCLETQENLHVSEKCLQSTPPICLSIVWHSLNRFYAACDDNIIREFGLYYNNTEEDQY